MADFDPLVAVLHLAVWVQRGHYSKWTDREMVRNFPIEFLALAIGLTWMWCCNKKRPIGRNRLLT